MRLRIFDLNTPWFWLVIFHQRTYGKPWLEISLWRPHSWQKWWVYFWEREKLPDERGQYAVTRETADV